MSDPDATDRIERIMRAGADRLRLGGFRKFILRGNVVDLATGIVIGAAFTAVVTALVSDFLTPLIGIPMSGANDFAKRYWDLGVSQFLYGDFVNKLF
jgi:large conductance mechanosensitive channel